MTNPISAVKFSSISPSSTSLNDKKPSSGLGRPLNDTKSAGDAVQVKYRGAEHLERPLSPRITSTSQALAALERLRTELSQDPEAGTASHRLGEAEVEALLGRPPVR